AAVPLVGQGRLPQRSPGVPGRPRPRRVPGALHRDLQRPRPPRLAPAEGPAPPAGDGRVLIRSSLFHHFWAGPAAPVLRATFGGRGVRGASPRVIVRVPRGSAPPMLRPRNKRRPVLREEVRR